ncbi:MAG: hypothetical protein Hens2KO_00800 [Henriciella sp.]
MDLQRRKATARTPKRPLAVNFSAQFQVSELGDVAAKAPATVRDLCLPLKVNYTDGWFNELAASFFRLEIFQAYVG